MLVIESIIKNLISGHRFEETLATFRIYEYKLSETRYNELQTLKNKIKENELGTLSVATGYESSINLEDSYGDEISGEHATIVISKRDNSNYFFTSTGFSKFLKSKNDINSYSSIRLGHIMENAIFVSLLIQPLYYDKAEIKLDEKKPISTLPYVKPLNHEAQFFLPSDVTKFILLNQIDLDWTIRSTIVAKLLCSICTDFYKDNSNISIFFRGNKSVELIIKISSEKTSEIFSILQTIASWQYLSNDIDTRHEIFSAEVSSVLPSLVDLETIKPIDLIDALKKSLNNAKLSYRYHLRESVAKLNAELLTLNKSIMNYTEGIILKTEKLVSTLWKDLTTVLAYLFLRFSLKSTDLPPEYLNWIGCGLIFYLVFSFSISADTGFQYYSQVASNIADWREKIYSYLSLSDFETLVSNKIGRSHKKLPLCIWNYSIVLHFHNFWTDKNHLKIRATIKGRRRQSATASSIEPLLNEARPPIYGH